MLSLSNLFVVCIEGGLSVFQSWDFLFFPDQCFSLNSSFFFFFFFLRQPRKHVMQSYGISLKFHMRLTGLEIR